MEVVAFNRLPDSVPIPCKGVRLGRDLEQMNPLVVNQVSYDLVLLDDGANRTLWRFYEDTETQGYVSQVMPIMQRLEWKSYAKVATIPFKDAKSPTYDVVQDFVPATVKAVINRGSVVLHIDPIGDEHRRSHDGFEHRAVGIIAALIFVQEYSTLQILASTTRPRCDEKRSIVGQPPLRPNL